MSTAAEAAVDQVLAGVCGVDEEILALMSLREQVDAALVKRVGAFDAGERYKDDGAFSFATWLRARADITAGDAGQLARLARSLRTMPQTAAAVADGKLSIAKARLMARVVNARTRPRFDEHESLLVDTVQGLDLDNAKIVLANWARRADTDGPDPGDPDRNRASLTTGWNGRFHLEGDFDQVSGAVLSAVLQAIVDRMQQDGRFNDLGPDNNTANRRLAEALIEMGRRASGRNPHQPAIHPELVIVVPHHHVTEAPPGRGDTGDREPGPFAEFGELVGVGPITRGDLHRLTEDATISALHLDGHGNPVRLSRKHRVGASLVDTVHAAVIDQKPGPPLNLGRAQRLATKAQWIVLWYRDRGCVVPGCHRIAAWCSAHHLTWWDRDHGPTDLCNLCLICNHHHHLIHDQGWTIHRHDDSWHLTRPDGTGVEPPRYPGEPHPRGRPAAL